MLPRSVWRGRWLVGFVLLAACRYSYERLPGQGEAFGVGAGGEAGAESNLEGGQTDAGTLSNSGGSASTGGSGSSAATAVGSGVGGIGGASSSGGTLGMGGTGESSTGESSSEGSTTTGGASGGPVVHCDELPKLALPPTLEGDPEPGMFLEDVVPMGWTGPNGIPDGVGMRFSAAWHESGLYFYIEVTDEELLIADAADPLWYGDGIEIYVDHDGSVSAAPGSYDTGTKQLVVQAPADASNDSDRADLFIPTGLERPWPDTQWVGKYTSYGYVVEALVTASDLDLSSWTLSAGNRVGIDLGHNVSYSTPQSGIWGYRLGQYFMQVAQPFTGSIDDFPFYDSRVFCTPVLLDGP